MGLLLVAVAVCERLLGGMRGILPTTTAGRLLRIIPAGIGTMLGILPSPSERPPSGYALGMAAPRVGRMPNIIPMPAGLIRSELPAVVAGRMPLNPPKGRSLPSVGWVSLSTDNGSQFERENVILL